MHAGAMSSESAKRQQAGTRITVTVPPDHFADISKMVEIGTGSQRQIDDIMLARYAC